MLLGSIVLPSHTTTQVTQSAGNQLFMPPRGLELMTQLVDVRGQPTRYQLDHGWTIEKPNLDFLSMLIITNKFITDEVLMVEELFKFLNLEI